MRFRPKNKSTAVVLAVALCFVLALSVASAHDEGAPLLAHFPADCYLDGQTYYPDVRCYRPDADGVLGLVWRLNVEREGCDVFQLSDDGSTWLCLGPEPVTNPAGKEPPGQNK